MSPGTAFAYDPADSEEVRLQKFAIFLMAMGCNAAGVVWAGMYLLVFGWGLTAALPLMFVAARLSFLGCICSIW